MTFSLHDTLWHIVCWSCALVLLWWTLPSVCIWCEQLPKMNLNLLWHVLVWQTDENESAFSRLRNVDTQEQPLRMHSFVWVFVSNFSSFCFSKIREIIWTNHKSSRMFWGVCRLWTRALRKCDESRAGCLEPVCRHKPTNIHFFTLFHPFFAGYQRYKNTLRPGREVIDDSEGRVRKNSTAEAALRHQGNAHWWKHSRSSPQIEKKSAQALARKHVEMKDTKMSTCEAENILKIDIFNWDWIIVYVTSTISHKMNRRHINTVDMTYTCHDTLAWLIMNRCDKLINQMIYEGPCIWCVKYIYICY